MSKEQLPTCSQCGRWSGEGTKEQFAHDPAKRAVKLIFAGLVLIGLLGGIRPQTALAVNLSHSVALSVGLGTNTSSARLYRPPGFATSTNLLPLVLFLHGVGESGTNNVAQVNNRIGGLINATQGTNYSAFLLAPQIPVGADRRQAQWRTLILNTLQAVQTNYPIAASRLYLTGVSLGAIGIYDYLPPHPDLFAAAAFNAPPPLSLRASVGQMVFAWPSWCARAVLECTSTLGASPGWAPVTNNAVITSGERSVTLAPSSIGQRFFRLRLQ